MGMHDLAGWSDEELDHLVDNFQPEYLPGLIKKGIKTEGGHTASSLCWEGLTYTNKADEKLLRHVSGYLHPGQIVGILAGPDGGATPLLNVLAGREKDSAWTGSVLYNGKDRTEEYTRVTGYVDKVDVHIPLLTVYETLYFSARLRLPQALPDNLVRLRVKITMKLLGLSHVAETYIGDASVRGVSGGEKRRVSFGVDMVAGRECLLADLPTNGLDSASAYSLMRTMRFVCKGGFSMMASVVQPSSELFQLFHNVLVLSKGRRAVLRPALASRELLRRRRLPSASKQICTTVPRGAQCGPRTLLHTSLQQRAATQRRGRSGCQQRRQESEQAVGRAGNER